MNGFDGKPATITFAVDRVERATEPLPTGDFTRTLEYGLHRRVLAASESSQQLVSRQRGHSLIGAVHQAFSGHRSLILSPDSIWLVIAQGFSHHVAEEAEVLRGRLVSHQGKRTLTGQLGEKTASGWSKLVARFSTQIRDAIDPVLHQTLLCDFSTTTPAIRTASEIVLMDSFSPFFDFDAFICGIPEITLQGTPEDWTRIRARVEVLETYGLSAWISRLRPILDQFVATAQGRISDDFWKAIYIPREAYGGKRVTGWISDLFPYLGDPPHRRRNRTLDQERCDWALGKDGIQIGEFPSGTSMASVKLHDEYGATEMVDFLGGFWGLGQRNPDLALWPVIGWSVVKSDVDPGIKARRSKSLSVMLRR